MVVLHQITSPLASSYKAVRLRALQDTPSAFGSTYARESQFTDADWQQRAANLCTPRSIGYLAHEEDYCGIAVSFLNEKNPQHAELRSMWVAPEQRRTGTGRLLVDAIESWARSCGAHTFQLMVTSGNLAAISFYQRLGFTPTGHTEPYPNDPALIEYEMSKSIV
ncbi:MAG: GNAT family N-acetyltransferase [Edaphobacter sp.]